jgi:hypothetical protein
MKRIFIMAAAAKKRQLKGVGLPNVQEPSCGKDNEWYVLGRQLTITKHLPFTKRLFTFAKVNKCNETKNIY